MEMKEKHERKGKKMFQTPIVAFMSLSVAISSKDCYIFFL